MRTVDMKALMAFFLFGSVTTSSNKTEHVLKGKVEEVDTGAHNIVIQAESGSETFPFTDSTKLTGLRPESKVKNVLPGDGVIVLYSEEGGEKQTQEIKSIKLAHRLEALEGNVVHFYKFTRLMFIEMSDGKEEVLQIAENAILILNGQLVTLADLAVEQGEWVKVYYTADLSLKTVQAMEGQQRHGLLQPEAAGQNQADCSMPTNFSTEREFI